MAKKVKKTTRKLSRGMRKKLIVLFSLLTFCLCALIGRLMYINYTSGEKYEKKVLSMQSYDSVTIPYQRGDIVDRNGTVMATSVAVYNVIMDCSVMTSETKVDGEKVQKYLEPTIDALLECFPELDKATLYQYATERPDSKYIVLLKKLPYEKIQPFVQMQEELDEDGKKENPNIKGVWFEKEYQRRYPFNSMASAVIGFASSGNVGTVGLENYYNDNKEVSTESAKWVVNELKDFMDLLPVAVTGVKCEVMVSDFETTASKVDVVVHCLDGTCYLFDVKTTSKFDREYCSLQLSVYKRLYESCYDEKVMGLYVLGTKMRRLFHIIEQDKAKTDKILSMNRG